MAAPLQESMNTAPIEEISTLHGFFLQQDQHACWWSLLGCCHSKAHYQVSKAPEDWDEMLEHGNPLTESISKNPVEFTVMEEPMCGNAVLNWCNRNVVKDRREAKFLVKNLDGSLLVEFHKPISLPRGCCCLSQEIATKLPDGTVLNRSKMHHSCCYPLAHFEKATTDWEGTVTYDHRFSIHPPVCCHGLCVKPECNQRGFCVVPFYFYDAKDNQLGKKSDDTYPPQIRMVRHGMHEFICTTGNKFAVNFPLDLTAEEKAGMLGMAILLDMAFFEKIEG